FGVLPTFEGSLAKIGVFSDGTGTTRIAGAGNPLRPLAPELQDTIQQSVEEGYNRFLSVVAKGRGLSRAKVAELAQGRVWDGATALKLGLVDKLGSLHDAVIAAAKLAGLSKYEAVYIRPELSPGQQLLQKLAQRASVLFEHSRFAGVGGGSMVREAVRERFLDFSLLAGDPEHMYARCLIPRSAIVF
ncbi:MAG TPA: signal peptide peptidase SppA, partial [Desulfobacteraceae bacterium]|nr:signal peptide peptidase SppA [Desulfobacteraceae bacterium]